MHPSAAISVYEAVCDEIVRLLRQERKRQKLSNYQVSHRSGVSESMSSLVECGLRNPTLELTLRIAGTIGADLPKIAGPKGVARSHFAWSLLRQKWLLP
jgi:transcriptional regulator with XRE-family HTH domain